MKTSQTVLLLLNDVDKSRQHTLLKIKKKKKQKQKTVLFHILPAFCLHKSRNASYGGMMNNQIKENQSKPKLLDSILLFTNTGAQSCYKMVYTCPKTVQLYEGIYV